MMVLLRADLILMLRIRRWRLREATWPLSRVGKNLLEGKLHAVGSLFC